MPRFFIKQDQEHNKQITIIGEDVNHIKNVLRKQVGDILEICNKDTQNVYKCKIENIRDNTILTNITEKLQKNEENIKIDIYQGLPKADKMELIIQKSVELGVNSIIPVEMKRCVVKIDKKNENKKIERWRKIAESAAKQSGRCSIPKVQNIITLEEMQKLKNEYDVILVCYENEKENYIKNELLKLKELKKENLKIAIIIGPEGGLEEKEVELLKQNDAKIITLGNIILRTETVSLNVISIIMYEMHS